jgi:hypothetical protein
MALPVAMCLCLLQHLTCKLSYGNIMEIKVRERQGQAMCRPGYDDPAPLSPSLRVTGITHELIELSFDST